MVDRRTALVAALGFILAAIALWAFGRWMTGALDADVASFDSGFIATVLGIVVGIPAALGISLGLRQRELHAQEDADRERYLQLLRTIDDDLRTTLEELVRESPNDRQPRTTPVAPFLGSGLWEALRSSGQAVRIQDPFLLRVVTRAYDRIALTGYLERLAWELDMNPVQRSLRVPPGMTSMLTEAVALIAQQDVHTKAAIDHARTEIAVELGRGKSGHPKQGPSAQSSSGGSTAGRVGATRPHA